MKSNNQRKVEIKALRAKKKQVAAERLAVTLSPSVLKVGFLFAGQALVNTTKLAANNSYSTPDFVSRGFYMDEPFTCKDCGVEEVWRATQQKWWYETIQGDVWTTAVRCNACRKKENARKTLARKSHLEGLAKKVDKQASE